MPVTAKLSRKFYEKLGDDIATELVEWFNLVDATYRSDLRELNDANFARFDAKLEQRLAETRAEMAAGFARFDAKLEQRLAETRADLRQEIASVRADLLKWMFVYWLGSAVTTAGLVLTVVDLLRR
jgi:hypothetical protein